GLLVPCDAELGKCLGLPQSELARVGAVGVHENLRSFSDPVAHRLYPRHILVGLAADLHLHTAQACSDPVAELFLELRDRVGGEASYSIAQLEKQLGDWVAAGLRCDP